MIPFRSQLFFTALVFLLISCNTTQKIASLKPEPDDASPLVYENAISYINMPIQIKLKDVENKINTSLAGLIYEDSNIEDDDIEVKIWKHWTATVDSKIHTVIRTPQ